MVIHFEYTLVPTQSNSSQHTKSYINNQPSAAFCEKNPQFISFDGSCSGGFLSETLYCVMLQTLFINLIRVDCLYLLNSFSALTSVSTKKQCNTLVWHHSYWLKLQANRTRELLLTLRISLNWESKGNNGSLCVHVFVEGTRGGVVQGVGSTSQVKQR